MEKSLLFLLCCWNYNKYYLANILNYYRYLKTYKKKTICAWFALLLKARIHKQKQKNAKKSIYYFPLLPPQNIQKFIDWVSMLVFSCKNESCNFCHQILRKLLEKFSAIFHFSVRTCDSSLTVTLLFFFFFIIVIIIILGKF